MSMPFKEIQLNAAKEPVFTKPFANCPAEQE